MSAATGGALMDGVRGLCLRWAAVCVVLTALMLASSLARGPVALADQASAGSEGSTATAADLDAADGAAADDGGEDPDEELADAQAAQAAAQRELGAHLGGDRGILPSGIDPSQATYVSISRLARTDLDLDGTIVSFRGEAVGEAVRSSVAGRVWVTMQTLTEGTASIGVLMDETQLALIRNWGAYGVRGTTLLVTGIYRVADANQSGTLDVVAYDVRMLDEGDVLPEWVSPKKLRLGIGLTALGLVLGGVGIYLRRRVRP